MKTLSKILDSVTQALGYLLGFGLVAMVLIMFAQVVYRYGFNNPIQWAEQVASWLLVWVVFLGGTVAYRQNKLIGVDIFILRLPRKLQLAVSLLFDLAILLFLWYFITAGYILAINALTQRVGNIELPPTYIYAAAPVCGVFFLVFTLEKLYFRVKEFVYPVLEENN